MQNPTKWGLHLWGSTIEKLDCTPQLCTFSANVYTPYRNIFFTVNFLHKLRSFVLFKKLLQIYEKTSYAHNTFDNKVNYKQNK